MYPEEIPVFEVKIKHDQAELTCPVCKKKNIHGAVGLNSDPTANHRLAHCDCWPNGYFLVKG
jgi:hypothetical protein